MLPLPVKDTPKDLAAVVTEKSATLDLREGEVTWFVHVPTALENLVVTGKTSHFIIVDHHPARNPPLKDSGDTHKVFPQT